VARVTRGPRRAANRPDAFVLGGMEAATAPSGGAAAGQPWGGETAPGSAQAGQPWTGETAPGAAAGELAVSAPALPPPDSAIRVTVAGDAPLVLDVVPDPAPTDGPVAGALASVRVLPRSDGEPGGSLRVEVVVDGWRFEATVEPARRAALRERVQRRAGGRALGRHVVRAPLPGRIVGVWVAVGDRVAAGARLCSLEAMKMENEVLAHRAGTIERVRVEPGARVEQGDELVVIA
jgi:biotin carboxyl carrier protein